jgi:deoxyinosine 3'endonuclease (endonuclease V)
MDDSSWLEIWYEALAKPIGVVVSTPDIGIAKAKLYRARAAAQDPALMNIQIRTSPEKPQSELWLVRSKKNGQTG